MTVKAWLIRFILGYFAYYEVLCILNHLEEGEMPQQNEEQLQEIMRGFR